MPRSRKRKKPVSNNKPAIKSVKNNDKDLPSPQGASFHMAKYYQGVIPPPEAMEHYSRIDPRMPERIMSWAEDEADHRRSLEKRSLNWSVALDILGNVFGLASVASVIWLCYQYLLKDAAEQGKVIAVSVIVSLASIFVLRRAWRNISTNKTNKKPNSN